MKTTILNCLVMLSVLAATQVAWAGDARLPLRVLYLGRDNDDQRTTPNGGRGRRFCIYTATYDRSAPSASGSTPSAPGVRSRYRTCPSDRTTCRTSCSQSEVKTGESRVVTTSG